MVFRIKRVPRIRVRKMTRRRMIKRAFKGIIRPKVRRFLGQLSGPVTNSCVRRLKYVDEATIDPAALGLVSYRTYSANSIYDPDVTGVGHQPMGHDQLQALYKNYVVLGSKITVHVIPTGTTNKMLVCGIFVDDNNSVNAGAAGALMENRLTKYKLVNNVLSDKITVLTKGFSTKKFFSLKDLRDNQDNVGALFGASPSKQGYFQVFAGAVNSADDFEPVRISVHIEYIVKCTEPIELGQS